MNKEYRQAVERIEAYRSKAKAEPKRLMAFRVPPEIEISVRTMAAIEEVPYSNLLSVLLELALENYGPLLRERAKITGDVELTPSEIRENAKELGVPVSCVHFCGPEISEKEEK